MVTWLFFFFFNFKGTYLQHSLRSTWTVHFLTELWWVWSLVSGFLAFSWQTLFRRCYFLRLMGVQSRSHSSCSMSDSGWGPDGMTINTLALVNSLSSFLKSHSHFPGLAIRICVSLSCTGLSCLLFAMQVPLLECPSFLLQLMSSHLSVSPMDPLWALLFT